jgi:hypothetical protein
VQVYGVNVIAFVPHADAIALPLLHVE